MDKVRVEYSDKYELSTKQKWGLALLCSLIISLLIHGIAPMHLPFVRQSADNLVIHLLYVMYTALFLMFTMASTVWLPMFIASKWAPISGFFHFLWNVLGFSFLLFFIVVFFKLPSHLINGNHLSGEVLDPDKQYFGEAAACDRTDQFCKTVFLAVSPVTDNYFDTLTTAFEQRENKHINTLCFNGPGGRVDETKKVVQYIRDNLLNTCIADRYYIKLDGQWAQWEFNNPYHIGYCNSACPIMVLSGIERSQYGDEHVIRTHNSGSTNYTALGKFKISSFAGYDEITDLFATFDDSAITLPFLSQSEATPHFTSVEINNEMLKILFTHRFHAQLPPVN
ncbi:hypothetical protein [Enterovibrio norvegicus]|uniref:hypothetical protein n=1 Tax=Enterovibrio norvegicus TaxID=188144 RepID=UPI000C83C563|nr:hypothetical protein [Enterovibrio norvegicus]PMH64502.1 hypothetical protein BCU62_15725 [Enterovibrio norvegicus]